jgi:hypothetical protein
MGASRFAGKPEEVYGFRRLAKPAKTVRAAARQVVAQFRGVALRERAQQP